MAATPAATQRDRVSERARAVRVAMVIQRFRPHFSGQGVQLETLVRELVAQGAEPTIYAIAPSGAKSSSEACAGYTICRLATGLLPGRLRWTPIFALRLLLALLRDRPDVVHVHTLTDGLYGAWLYARLRRAPLIFEMTLLGDDDPMSVRANRARPRALRWRMFRSCDGYVAMSRAFLDPYRRASLPGDRLRLIPQGVDVARFRAGDQRHRLQIRRQLDLEDDAPLVVFVGSLVHRKGIDVLLRAWCTIQANRPTARLLLVGPDAFDPGDPNRELLQRCLKELPSAAGARVHRLGVREDTEAIVGASDVFVLPTRREGFGSAIIEAMACSLPCVVTELPGITDFIFASPAAADLQADPETDGVVVAQENADELATAVCGLLADPALRRSVGDAARARAVGKFDMRTVAASYLAYYDELRAGRVTDG